MSVQQLGTASRYLIFPSTNLDFSGIQLSFLKKVISNPQDMDRSLTQAVNEGFIVLEGNDSCHFVHDSIQQVSSEFINH